MNEKDKRIVKSIIEYCDRMNEHVTYFGNDKDDYFLNKHYRDAYALVIIQIGEFVGRLSNEFKKEHKIIP